MSFDTIIAVDWSASAKPSPKRPRKDAIYICVNGPDHDAHPVYFRTRATALAAITQILDSEIAKGHRTLLGCDFAFGYPAGFAHHLTGSADVFAVWDLLATHIHDDDDNANNRFDVADMINRRFPGTGPFWGCPPRQETDALPQKGSLRVGHGMAERRQIETTVPGAQSVWKLFTTGSVGSQSLMGIPRLQALRARYGANLHVWPFATATTPIVIAEIYPSIMQFHRPIPLAQNYPNALYHIPDAVQVRDVCDTLRAALHPDAATDIFTLPHPQDDVITSEEGWILGVNTPNSHP